MYNAENDHEVITPQAAAAAVQPTFRQTLARHNLQLNRGKTTTLQVNTGLLCNQVCRHCHLNAGPGRREIMAVETMAQVAEFAAATRPETIDITGGAPEMNPGLPGFLERLAPSSRRLILRSNLTAINENGRETLMDLCKQLKITIFASLPSINEAQAETQRGSGVFQLSLATLRRLNLIGYGQADSGLELNLVANPTGAFLPSPQDQTEKRFRQVLDSKFGISFNNLYTFANVPLGRFQDWLLRTGNQQQYQQKLADSFNPCAVDGLMCRSLLSIGWDGFLYDCDFNLACRLHLGGRKTHITELAAFPEPGTPIAVSEHCFTCTAGAGFT